MSGPFRDLFGSRPNSTTHTPNQDIVLVLMHGIKVSGISMLGINYPAQSDHLGIVVDLDMESFFSSIFSDLATRSPRNLTSGNKKSGESYLI
jgi:hypothetical protein